MGKLLFQTDDFAGGRTPRLVLGVDTVTIPKQGEQLACLGHLKVGQQFDTGYTEGAPATSGYCMHTGDHLRCQQVLVTGRGLVHVCPCDCHGVPADNEFILLRDDRRRCRICSDYLAPKRMGRGGDPICVDSAQCAERRRALLKSNAKLARMAELDLLREDHMVTEAKEKKVREPAKPKVGTCEFTGKATKGGRFTPGGDAKLKSALLEAANSDGASSPAAAAELIVRSWPTKAVSLDAIKTAKAILKDQDGVAFVAKRVEARLAKVAKGTDPREAVTSQR